MKREVKGKKNGEEEEKWEVRKREDPAAIPYPHKRN